MNDNGIIGLYYNQNKSCFACCTKDGVRIYNNNSVNFRSILNVGSITICEMFGRTNVLALVAGGYNQFYSRNTVLLYDCSSEKFIMEVNCTSPVLAVRIRRNCLIVVTKDMITMFSFPNPIQHVVNLETDSNTLGLCEVSVLPNSLPQLLVYPGNHLGSVYILDISNIDAIHVNPSFSFSIFKEKIECLALNMYSTVLAVANAKGLIKVVNIGSKSILNVLTCGRSQIRITCIDFNLNSTFMCCSSTEGVIYVFALKNNDHHSFNMSGFTTDLQPQNCYMKFLTPEKTSCICSFWQLHTIGAISMSGKFHIFIMEYPDTRRGLKYVKSGGIYFFENENDANYELDEYEVLNLE